MRRIKIFDTTLRDGEQSPGIALQPHEKAEIARSLEELGVDVVEAGFAASSPGDHAGVAAVAAAANWRAKRPSLSTKSLTGMLGAFESSLNGCPSATSLGWNRYSGQ